MKKTVRLFVILALSTLPDVGSAQLGGPAADMGAINTALAELLKTFQERNVAGLAALMANELQAYGSSFNASNLEQWRAKAPAAVSTVRGVRVVGKQDVTMSGNLAYVNFMTDVQREAASGVTTDRARWTVIFQKTNNRWVIVHYHLSPDPGK